MNITDIPTSEQLYMVTSVDICDYIGAYDYDYIPRQRRMCGLYFPPREFPPPTNADSGGNNDTFRRLKTYIEAVSDAEQSPVICSGGSRTRHNKVFTCKKNKCGQRKTCPFSFLLSWDERGYFIHLLSLTKTRWYTCGCPWHCCK